MEKDRQKVCEIISEMLDNPDEDGIYPTTRAYHHLERLISDARIEAVGWMHAEACSIVANGEDIKDVDDQDLIKRIERDMSLQPKV